MGISKLGQLSLQFGYLQAASHEAIMLLLELVLAAASQAGHLGVRVQLRVARMPISPVQCLRLDELRVDGQWFQVLDHIFRRIDVQRALNLVAISCWRLLELMGQAPVEGLLLQLQARPHVLDAFRASPRAA